MTVIDTRELPPHYVSEMLPQYERVSAFNLICQTLARKTHYASTNYQRYFANEVILSRHPFEHASNPVSYAEFVGSPGHTASIGAFIYKILSRQYTAPTELIFWMCREDDVYQKLDSGLAIGHMIYAEVRFGDYDTYLCGGMTDFLGEGGGDFNDVCRVFSFMSEVYRISIKYVYLDDATGKAVEKEIGEQIDEYYKEWGGEE